jgi:Predicted SAM-dependent methyltransferase
MPERSGIFIAMKLKDKRLRAIIDLLPRCGVIADIGTDHGKLGCALLEEDKCLEVWFSDISAVSLQKAKALAEMLGLGRRSKFFVGDGARALPGSPDAAVIAGMGGKTICGILENGLKVLSSGVLVLAANTEQTLLRTFIMDNGLLIDEERAVRAAGRYYVLMRVIKGIEHYTYRELTAGPKLIEKKDDETTGYFRFRHRVALTALQQAKTSLTANVEELKKELDVWETLI